MKRYISEGLQEYLNKNHEAWHMPGHKRRAQFQSGTALCCALNQAFSVDVTELSGTDDLYAAEDFLKLSMEQLAEIYGTVGSFYVVNGATGGVLAAIAGCAARGDGVLMARNCHKSVYNAVEVLGLLPEYVYPTWGSEKVGCNIEGFISPEDVRAALAKNGNLRVVVVTSPTYQGVISDIEAIAQAVHDFGRILIVDEAHGAHLPFMEGCGDYVGANAYGTCDDAGAMTEKRVLTALHAGADVVVQSTHKTLPALTQTALLHVCNKELLEPVKKCWSVFNTSSPSYLLMASTEEAVCLAAEFDFEKFVSNLHDFRQKCKNTLSNIHLVERDMVRQCGAWEYDLTRLVLFAEDAKGRLAGVRLAELLAEQNLVCEMAGEDYVVLISTMADGEREFDALVDALSQVDIELSCERELPEPADEGDRMEAGDDLNHENCYDEAYLMSRIGERAHDNVFVYPPGSYILTKGERIQEHHIETLLEYQRAGLRIRGKI